MKWAIVNMALALSGLCTAQQEDHQPVEKTVRSFLVAMTSSDTSAVKSYTYDEFTLKSVVKTRKGETILVQEDAPGFLLNVADKHAEKWEERISNTVVHMDQQLAVLWCDYEFYVDGNLSHKGADVFQLILTDGGWKIFYICDTRHN